MEDILIMQKNINKNNKRYDDYFDELVNWKKIIGYDNYSVHSSGIVRNDKTGSILIQNVRKDDYLQVKLCRNGKQSSYLVHQLLGKAFLDNSDSKLYIDHIDNNRANNNIENLRWSSAEENNRNAKIRKDNTSGSKGVYFDKRYNRWKAQINYNGKRMHLGCFKTLQEAKEARQNKAKELFGEYINKCEI